MVDDESLIWSLLLMLSSATLVESDFVDSILSIFVIFVALSSMDKIIGSIPFDLFGSNIFWFKFGCWFTMMVFDNFWFDGIDFKIDFDDMGEDTDDDGDDDGDDDKQ